MITERPQGFGSNPPKRVGSVLGVTTTVPLLSIMSLLPYRDVAIAPLPEGLACSVTVLFHDLE